MSDSDSVVDIRDGKITVTTGEQVTCFADTPQAAATQVAVLHSEIERQRERVAEAEAYETSFTNACLYAGLDTGRSLDALEEDLVSLIKTCKAAEAAHETPGGQSDCIQYTQYPEASPGHPPDCDCEECDERNGL